MGHDVEGISDRDILSYNANLNAKNTLNRIFLEKALYYRPDIILLGHVNTIEFKTFSKNWWMRRSEAHDFFSYISKKFKIEDPLSIDKLTTKFFNNIFYFK